MATTNDKRNLTWGKSNVTFDVYAEGYFLTTRDSGVKSVGVECLRSVQLIEVSLSLHKQLLFVGVHEYLSVSLHKYRKWKQQSAGFIVEIKTNMLFFQAKQYLQ